MRILCCYANLHPATAASIAEFAQQTELIDVTGDVFGYWNNVRKRWVGEEDLVIFEQDMEITAQVVPSFEACSEPWCLYEYQGHSFMGTLSRHLGCTRFSKELQLAVPSTKIAPDRQRWDTLDGRVSMRLEEFGYKPHIHGAINHLHNYDEDRWSKLDCLRLGDTSLKDFVEYMADFCNVKIIDNNEEK